MRLILGLLLAAGALSAETRIEYQHMSRATCEFQRTFLPAMPACVQWVMVMVFADPGPSGFDVTVKYRQGGIDHEQRQFARSAQSGVAVTLFTGVEDSIVLEVSAEPLRPSGAISTLRGKDVQ